MRIAFIVVEFPVLESEMSILNQLTGLIDRGHDVDIIAERRGNLSRMHALVADYGLLQRTRYFEMPRNRALRLLKAVGLLMARGWTRPGAFVRSLNVRRYGVQAASLVLLHAAASLPRRQRYDAIHCQFGRNGIRGMFLRESGLMAGKLVTQFRGSDLNVYPRRVGLDVYDKLFQTGDQFLVLSRFLAKRAIDLGCRADRVVRLPLGVDLNRLPFVERHHSPDEPIRVLTVARLVEVKGVDYAIRAIARVAAHFPNVHYRIVGGGPLREPLQTLARQEGLADQVEFLGPRPHDEVVRLYQQAHLFLLSGVVDRQGAEEGLGTVLVEAQATGLPVVASNVGGIPENVLDGESGFLVPQRDVDAIAEKLCFLIEHPETWPALGRAGRRHVEVNFDNAKLTDGLLEIYEQLLDPA